LGNHLIIKIDQQSLRFMDTQKMNEGIQHKLLLKQLEFDYTIDTKRQGEHCRRCPLKKGFSLTCHHCLCPWVDRGCQAQLHSRSW
jgi:hypothetical protein